MFNNCGQKCYQYYEFMGKKKSCVFSRRGLYMAYQFISNSLVDGAKSICTKA